MTQKDINIKADAYISGGIAALKAVGMEMETARKLAKAEARIEMLENALMDGLFEQTSKNFALTIDAKRWHSKPPAT